MNALDCVLDGDEQIVQQIAAEHGLLTAERFVSSFNNACLQMVGFESTLQQLSVSGSHFIAPMYNCSAMEH